MTQKDFALAVVPFPFSGVLFAMRKGRTVKQCLADMHIDKLMALLGLQDTASTEEDNGNS